MTAKRAWLNTSEGEIDDKKRRLQQRTQQDGRAIQIAVRITDRNCTARTQGSLPVQWSVHAARRRLETPTSSLFWSLPRFLVAY